MGTITAKTLITRVSHTMQDYNNTHWLIPEHLDYLNDAQRQLVIYIASACTKNEPRKLEPGTLQTIPAEGYRFIKGHRNMGLSGATPGRAVRAVDYDTLSDANPDWHTSTPADVVLEYAFDMNDPKRFYVWPPQPSSTHYLQITYSCTPTVIAGVNSVITVDDVYANAIMEYMEYRAWRKGGKDMNIAKSDAAFTQFANALGLKLQSDQMIIPGNAVVTETEE